jgi:hypothetical protein
MHQNARRSYDNYKTASCDVLEAVLTNDSKVISVTECHTDWLSTLWRQKVSAEHHTLDLLYLNYKIHECLKQAIFRNFLQKRIQTLNIFHDKWVSVTTAWRVLRLRMEERPPILRVAATILNKQLGTAEKGVVFQLEGWSRC